MNLRIRKPMFYAGYIELGLKLSSLEILHRLGTVLDGIVVELLNGIDPHDF